MFDALGPTVGWIVTAVAAIVVLDLIFVVEVPRAIREFRRLTIRLGAFGDLPIVTAAGNAERDIERISDSAAEISVLLERAGEELTTIRTGVAEIVAGFRRR